MDFLRRGYEKWLKYGVIWFFFLFLCCFHLKNDFHSSCRFCWWLAIGRAITAITIIDAKCCIRIRTKISWIISYIAWMLGDQRWSLFFFVFFFAFRLFQYDQLGQRCVFCIHRSVRNLVQRTHCRINVYDSLFLSRMKLGSTQIFI